MKTIKISNKPVILENHDFQTVMIQVMFPFKNNPNDLAKISLLPKLLNIINNKYKTEKEFNLEMDRLYILGSGVSSSLLGEQGYFSFNMTVADSNILKEDYLEKQIDFFSNMIYNPRIENNGFLQFEIDKEIDNIKKSMDNSLKNMRPYHSIRVREIVDDEGIFSRSLINNRELLDEITPNELYKYYLDVIYNNQPVIYFFGNVDNKQVNDLCNKYLYKKKFENKRLEYRFSYFLKPREAQYIEEDSTFKDSFISYLFKIQDMKQEDILMINTIRQLLNSLSSRLLDKKLRGENDLTYSTYATCYDYYGVFEITALINKNNVDIVKEKIEEVMNDLKNEELISPLLDNIKDRSRLNLLRKLDNKVSIFSEFVCNDIGFEVTMEEKYEKLLKISAKDIVNFIDRLKLDTIYFLKEEENE